MNSRSASTGANRAAEANCYRLFERAAAVEPLPYESLVKCSARPPF